MKTEFLLEQLSEKNENTRTLFAERIHNIEQDLEEEQHYRSLKLENLFFQIKLRNGSPGWLSDLPRLPFQSCKELGADPNLHSPC